MAEYKWNIYSNLEKLRSKGDLDKLCCNITKYIPYENVNVIVLTLRK